MLAFSDVQTDENAFVMNDAPGVMGFQILEDPRQPRVRALQVETAGGGTFTLALDARVAMALATTLVSAALAIDPTLKENFIEHVNKSQFAQRPNGQATKIAMEFPAKIVMAPRWPTLANLRHRLPKPVRIRQAPTR